MSTDVQCLWRQSTTHDQVLVLQSVQYRNIDLTRIQHTNQYVLCQLELNASRSHKWR